MNFSVSLLTPELESSVLNPTVIEQPLALPWSTRTIQIVCVCVVGRVTNEPQQVPVFKLMPYCLSPLRDKHPFILSFSIPFIIGLRFIREIFWNSFLLKGENNSRI